MAPRPKNRGPFGRLDELREQAVKIQDYLRELESENAELRKMWNPNWGKRSAMDYDPDQLLRGIKVEHEHTPVDWVAAQIAMDHIDEFFDYYDYLELMEKLMKERIPIEDVRLVLFRAFGQIL